MTHAPQSPFEWRFAPLKTVPWGRGLAVPWGEADARCACCGADSWGDSRAGPKEEYLHKCIDITQACKSVLAGQVRACTRRTRGVC